MAVVALRSASVLPHLPSMPWDARRNMDMTPARPEPEKFAQPEKFALPSIHQVETPPYRSNLHSYVHG